MRRCKNCRHYNCGFYHVAPVDLPDTCGHKDHTGEIRQPLDTCADHEYAIGNIPEKIGTIAAAFKKIPSHFRTGEEQ